MSNPWNIIGWALLIYAGSAFAAAAVLAVRDWLRKRGDDHEPWWDV